MYLSHVTAFSNLFRYLTNIFRHLTKTVKSSLGLILITYCAGLHKLECHVTRCDIDVEG